MIGVLDVDAQRALSGESARDAIVVVQRRVVSASGARRTFIVVPFAPRVLVAASVVAVGFGGVVVQQTTQGIGGQEGRQHHERSQSVSRRAAHRHNPGE